MPLEFSRGPESQVRSRQTSAVAGAGQPCGPDREPEKNRANPSKPAQILERCDCACSLLEVAHLLHLARANHTLVPPTSTQFHSGPHAGRRRRRSGARRGRAVVGVLLVSLTVAGAFFAAHALRRPGADSVSSPVANESEDHQWALDALARGDLNVASPEVVSGRPVYRYSVVPGGTHNPDELREAIEHDAVVAAHYKHLDQSRLRTEVVPSDRLVHVSYRKGDRVFWTAKKVLLRKGETILTDGTTQVRARCGNCIAEQPAGPTSDEEPDVVEFDRLVDAPPAPGAPVVALVPAALPQAQGLAAGGPSSSAPFASSMSGLGPGSTFPGGAPLGGGSQGIGAGTPDPLVSATKAGSHDTGSTPGSPDTGSPGKPGDNNPPNDPPTPPGSDQPFPPIIPFPPGIDNPFPPGTDDPFPPGTDDPFPPGTDNPFPPENPPPGGPDNPIPPPTDYPPGSPENPTPVPEPGTLLLVGGGAAELIRRLRRRSLQR